VNPNKLEKAIPVRRTAAIIRPSETDKKKKNKAGTDDGLIGQVKACVVLEISSLYRPEYHFKQLFYVFDISAVCVEMPSPQVNAAAHDLGVRLALNYDTDPTHNKLDFFISQNHTESFYGFALGEQKVTLIETQVLAYYSHFGYVLWGSEKKMEEEEKKGDVPPSAPPTNADSSGSSSDQNPGPSGKQQQSSKASQKDMKQKVKQHGNKRRTR